MEVGISRRAAQLAKFAEMPRASVTWAEAYGNELELTSISPYIVVSACRR